MPIAPPRACDFPGGCPNFAEPGGWLCATHKQQSAENKREQDRFRYRTDPVRNFEKSRDWQNTSLAFRRRNPLCQLILPNGQQCEQPAQAVHHVKPPETHWELRFDWKNLVGLCNGHHHKHEGDPAPRQYAPTRLLDGTLHTPPNEMPPAQRKPKKSAIDWDAPFSLPG